MTRFWVLLMKKLPLFSMALLLAGVLFAQGSRAEDYTRLNLPNDALARLGKGSIGRGDRAVAYSPDGVRLAVATSLGIWLYDARTGAEVALLQGHTHWVTSVSFSPDGQTVASGSGDRTVRLWDVSSGQSIAVLRGHTDRVHSVSFSPDGQTVASGSVDRTVWLWDVSSGQPIAVLEGHTDGVISVSFSPDGQTVASGSADATILLWDMTFVLSAVNVFWGAAGYRVVEESEVAVSVRLHRAPERTVTIPLIRMPESGGYSGVPSTVTFTGDQTEQTFTLTATDDIVEAKTVSLRFGTLPEGVRSGSPATTVVSIAEDENLFNLLNDALARLGKGIMRALYAWLQHLLCLIGQVML